RDSVSAHAGQRALLGAVTTTAMAQLELTGLVKRYGANQVVHGIDLAVADGEFVVFVGPSGSGKSTTLRMIAGLEDIDQGSISIGGRIVNRLPPEDRNVAMVFQNYAIYPHMNVAENIGFGLHSTEPLLTGTTVANAPLGPATLVTL